MGLNRFPEIELMASRRASKQEVYAENLKGTPMGLALYEPIPLRFGSGGTRDLAISASGHVGDIAFFDQSGTYKWVANAFCSPVCLSDFGVTD